MNTVQSYDGRGVVAVKRPLDERCGCMEKYGGKVENSACCGVHGRSAVATKEDRKFVGEVSRIRHFDVHEAR